MYLCDRTLQFDVLKVSVGKMLLLKAIADALQPDEATKIEIRREETSSPSPMNVPPLLAGALLDLVATLLADHGCIEPPRGYLRYRTIFFASRFRVREGQLSCSACCFPLIALYSLRYVQIAYQELEARLLTMDSRGEYCKRC